MAITLPPVTGNIAAERRTWRTNIESPKGAAPSVTAHRELVRSLDGEVISKSIVEPVNRNVADVLTEEITLASGKVISAADIAEALPKFIDAWEAEDIADREAAGS